MLLWKFGRSNKVGGKVITVGEYLVIMKKWRVTIVGILLISAIAIFLRLYQLEIVPVFVDEAIYVRWAQVMRAEPSLRFLPLSDGKQPLFMWLTMPMFKIISDPLVAGRMLSVASGMGTMLGVFFLAQILFRSKKVSLFASLLYALSPFAFFFDRLALVDSMLSCFGVWTLVLTILTIKLQRLDLAMISGFVLGAAWLTKSPALFFTIMLPSTLLFVPMSSGKKPYMLIKSLFLVAVILGLSFVIYNILRLGPNFELIGSRNFDYVYPYSHILTSPLDPLRPHLDRALEWFEIMGPSSVIIAVVVAVITNVKRYRREVAVLLVWSIVPIVVEAEFSRVFTSRYIFFVLPPLFVLAGSVVLKFTEKRHYYASYLLVTVATLQSIFFYVQFFNNPATSPLPERDGYLADWTSGYGIKEASRLILAERDANPDSKIVVGTEGYFGTLPDGLQIYLEKQANITTIGVGIDLVSVPQSLVDSAKSGNTTYLLANESRLRFEKPYEKIGLKEIAKYQKPVRRDGTQDTMYLLEVLQ